MRVAKVEIAVTDGTVAEGDVVTIGDNRVVALSDRKWNEIIRFALQGSRGIARQRQSCAPGAFGNHDRLSAHNRRRSTPARQGL